MRQKFSPWKNILFILGALIIAAFLIIISGCATQKVPVTLENCTPNTWVGGVRWNDDKTDYFDVPELEIKGLGSVTAECEKGLYGITHYRPRTLVRTPDGRVGMLPPAILDYRDDVKIDKPTTLYFGCEE